MKKITIILIVFLGSLFNFIYCQDNNTDSTIIANTQNADNLINNNIQNTSNVIDSTINLSNKKPREERRLIRYFYENLDTTQFLYPNFYNYQLAYSSPNAVDDYITFIPNITSDLNNKPLDVVIELAQQDTILLKTNDNNKGLIYYLVCLFLYGVLLLIFFNSYIQNRLKKITGLKKFLQNEGYSRGFYLKLKMYFFCYFII